MKEFWIYTGMRVALFLGSFAIVAGIWAMAADEVPFFWVVLVAFVLSGIGSYFLLNRQREAFAQRVDERAQRIAKRMNEKEDVE